MRKLRLPKQFNQLLMLAGISLMTLTNVNQAKAQCTSGSNSPTGTFTVSPYVQTLISTNMFPGNYVNINIVTPGEYEIAASFGSYFTVTDALNSPLAWGANSLYYNFPTVGNYRLYLHSDAFCGVGGGSRIVAMAPRNKAFNFDGVDDYIDAGLGITNYFKGKDKITVEAWVYPTQNTVGKSIVSNHENYTQFNIQQAQDKYIFFIGFGTYAVQTAANSVQLNTWQHVAGVFDDNVIKIYLNGVLSATTAVPSSYVLSTVCTTPLMIGKSMFGGEQFQGNIDEVRIWDRALCGGEIATLKAGPIPTSATGLKANYHFNQGTAGANNAGVTTLPDESGNSFNGTVMNATLNGLTSNWVVSTCFATGSPEPIYTPPTISITGTTSICSGATTTLTASGVSTYTWVSGPTTATTAVTPSITTTYSVTGTNSVGCVSNMATQLVTVNTIPTVSVNSGSICSGNSFTITPSGANTYTIQGGASVVSPMANATYTVIGSSTAGCVSANTATSSVTVNTTPTVSVNSGSICSGNLFIITPSGANTYTIQGGASIVNPMANATYTVIGSSTAGCVSANTATSSVTVNTTPTVSVNSGSICSGNSFTIMPSGANTYTIQGGASVVSPMANATYTVKGTSTAGCVSANTATSSVTVNTTPTVSVNSGSICSGTSFTIMPSGANTYTIQGGASVVSPMANATYTVIGSSTAGCVSANTATSSVNVNICTAAEALNFDGVNDYVNIPNNSSFNFGTNDFTIETYAKTNTVSGNKVMVGKIAGATNYWLGVGSGKATFSMIGGADAVSSTSIDDGNWHHIAAVRQSGVVSLYVDGVLEVSQNNTGTATISGNLTIGNFNGGYYFQGAIDEVRIWSVARTQCEINTYKDCEIPTNAAGLVANYHFNQGSNGVANPGITTLMDATTSANNGSLTNFALTGATSNWIAPGAVVSGYTTALAMPTISATATSSAICIGDSTMISTTTTGGINVYSWNTGATTMNISVTPTMTTSYTVTGTNTITGCATNAMTNVVVNALPTLTVSATSNTICAGTNDTLVVSGANTYMWDSNAGNAMSDSVIVMPTSNTSYTVIGTDANGCLNSTNINLYVNILPTVTLDTLTSPVCVNSGSMTLNGMPSGGVYSGTGVSGSSFDPSVSGAGTFTVTYTYTDANTCSNEASQEITVDLCTGVAQLGAMSDKFSVYPNPTNNSLTISSDEELGLVKVYDVLGKIVFSEKFLSSETTINLSHITSGVYYVILKNTSIKVIKE